MKKTRTQIEVSKLQLNTGQMQWLPKNPRQWTQTDLDRTKQSITEDEDFLEDRPVLVVPNGKKYCVFAGNLRTTALQELKAKTTPAIVYEPETEDDRQTIIRRAMKDNGSFGSWDFDTLANEWDSLPLTDWGVPAWETKVMDEGDAKESEEPVVNPKAEELLNKAMQENCDECVRQIDLTLKEGGFLITGYTIGLAKAYFINALYYAKTYPRWISYIFHPHQFLTSANNCSMYERMCRVAKEGKAGIAGFRTITEDKKPLTTAATTKGSYPIGGARLPLDFPVDKTKELITEFAGEGADILDPCHGWGGRFVGALLSGVRSYTGCDPCEPTHKGLEKMREAYIGYCEKTESATFLMKPYEDCQFEEESFDFALTSPPYFDVEQYMGDEQSHIRYPKYDIWRDTFYTQLIANTYRWLKRGKVFALQVGSQTYPLLEDAKKIAFNVGFVVEDIRPLGGSTNSGLHGNSDDDEENEKIIILRKP